MPLNTLAPAYVLQPTTTTMASSSGTKLDTLYQRLADSPKLGRASGPTYNALKDIQSRDTAALATQLNYLGFNPGSLSANEKLANSIETHYTSKDMAALDSDLAGIFSNAGDNVDGAQWNDAYALTKAGFASSPTTISPPPRGDAVSQTGTSLPNVNPQYTGNSPPDVNTP